MSQGMQWCADSTTEHANSSAAPRTVLLMREAAEADYFPLHLYILQMQHKASRGLEPRSLDSGSRVLAVTPRGHLM